jgi:hypothetical protein
MPIQPPSNIEYMVAAYLVAGIIVVAYAVWLSIRVRRLQSR